MEATLAEAANELVRLSVDRGCRVRRLKFAHRLSRATSERLAGAVLNAYVEACSRSTRAGVAAQAVMGVVHAQPPLPAVAPAGGRDPVPVPTPTPSEAAIQAFDRRLHRHMDELALQAKEEADRLERVTATTQTPYTTVTVTASGRLRRVAFHPSATGLAGEDLAADLMEALAEAEAEAAQTADGA